MRVDAGIAVRTELLFQVRDQSVDRFAPGGEQFQQHHPGQNPVAFGNVSGKSDAAAFLETQ